MKKQTPSQRHGLSGASVAPQADAAKRVVITGAAGYLGQKLVQTVLAESSAEVIAIDKSEMDRACQGVHFVKTDLSTPEGEQAVSGLGELLEDAAIFHLAGLFVKDIDVSRTVSPAEYARDNLTATRRLVNGILESGHRPRLFVFSSTACVYDGAKTHPTPVEEAFPIVPYAETKLDAEKEVRRLAGYVPHVVVLRLSRVIGLGEGAILPRDIVSDFIERLIRADVKGEKHLIGSGGEIRAYVHIDDLMSILLRQVEEYEQEGFIIRNVTSVDPIRVSDIGMIVAETMAGEQVVRREQQPRILSGVKTKVPVLNPLPYQRFIPGTADSAEVVRSAAKQYCRMLKGAIDRETCPSLESVVETIRR